jgi:hypothetical protein
MYVCACMYKGWARNPALAPRPSMIYYSTIYRTNGNAVRFYSGGARFQSSAGTQAEDSRSFLQSLHGNSVKVPRLGHNVLLPNPS